MRKTKHNYQHVILQAQLEIQEQFFLHLSSELHDNLGQIASLIKINLHTLQLNDIANASRKLEDTRALAKQLISDIKSLSLRLSSARLMQGGLIKALEQEIEQINNTGAFTAMLNISGDVPAIDNNKAIILYRIIQETLNNTVKHGLAQNIHLGILTRENFVIFTLTDDAKGFDAAEKMKNTEASLHNLKKRARLIEANMSVETNPDKGTTITIEFPNTYVPNTPSKASPGG